MRTITFPDSMDLTESDLMNQTFKTFEELQNFYWNCSNRQAEELEAIYSEDGISLKHLVNYPHQYNIVNFFKPKAMRTIRTKVYQFSELSEQAKQKAISDKGKEISKTLKLYGFVSHTELLEALRTIEANEYEFKADGTRF